MTMTIGDNIRKRRKQIDVTLEDVASTVGVSRQTMSRYETGVIKTISPQRIMELAKALKTSSAYLLGYVDDPELTSESIEEFERNLRNHFLSEKALKVKEAEEELISAAHCICMTDVPAPNISDVTPEKINAITEFIRENESELHRRFAKFGILVDDSEYRYLSKHVSDATTARILLALEEATPDSRKTAEAILSALLSNPPQNK